MTSEYYALSITLTRTLYSVVREKIRSVEFEMRIIGRDLIETNYTDCIESRTRKVSTLRPR